MSALLASRFRAAICECDTAFSKRSAPNPIYVGDFVFHDVDCWVRWKNRGMLGMT